MFPDHCITRLNELEVDFLNESFKRSDSLTKLLTYFHDPRDKNSTRPLVITSEIEKGQVILP